MTGVAVADDKLEWNEPESVCKVTDYVVEVLLINIDQCESAAIPITNNITLKTNMVLPPLKYFSAYAVTIQARSGDTSYGTGEANTTKFTTEISGAWVLSSLYNIYYIPHRKIPVI